MTFRKFIPLVNLALLLVIAGTASAQQYQRKETETELGKTSQQVYINNAGNYLVVSSDDDGEDVAVAAYDSQMKQLYMNKLQQFSKQEYMGGFCNAAGLFLFGYDDGQMFISRVDDQTGTVSGAPAALFPLKEKKRDDVYYFFKDRSPDSAYYYVGCWYHAKGVDGMSIDGVIMDRQMKVVSKFSYTTPEEHDDVEGITGVLSNKGTMFLVYNISEKADKDNYVPIKYTVVHVTGKGKASASPLRGLPEGEFDKVTWSAKDDVLQFTGLLSRKKKSGFTAMVSGTYDPLQKKITGTKETELKQLVSPQSASVFYKGIAEDGLPSVSVDNFHNADGSQFIVYQIVGSYTVQRFRKGKYGPEPSYSITFQRRGNICIVKVNADNEPQWMKVVPVDQEEPDLNLHLGACYVKDSQSGIHIFFYDVQKNAAAQPDEGVARVGASDIKNVKLAAVSVNANGEVKKSFLYDIDESDFHLSPERSYALKDDELVYIAIRHKGLSFTSHGLFRKADYHLGTIAVKP